MTRKFTIQCAYNTHYANTVTVEADSLDEALEKAIETANEDPAGWRGTDHCFRHLHRRGMRGRRLRPLGRGRVARSGPFFGAWRAARRDAHRSGSARRRRGLRRPGAGPHRGRGRDGHLEVRDPPHPPTNKPLVTVSLDADGKPSVRVEGGSARVRIVDA